MVRMSTTDLPPEPFEDKPRERITVLGIVSVVHVLLCVAIGTASLLVYVPSDILALAGVLFIVAVAVLVWDLSRRKS